jgi:hypothetical protein
LDAVDRADVVEGVDGGGETAVQAENLQVIRVSAVRRKKTPGKGV